MTAGESLIPPSGGILLLDKPSGYTSHDAVNRLRRLFDTKQVGHTGTLDPLATGVLCLLVGRAVKACEYSLSHPKSYIADMRLGIKTDTGDITGNVIRECNIEILPEQVIKAASGFIGQTMQIPPMYSALKVDGKKLCDIARAGGNVERVPRPITVYSLSITHISDSDYRLEATVSSGTYIRTLCEDIGEAAGSCATMLNLRRTSGSGFDISEAVTLDQLEEMTSEQRVKKLLPTEMLFVSQPVINLDKFNEKLIRNGCAVKLSKLSKADYEADTLVRIHAKDKGFFAVGKITDGEEGHALKADKIFVL